MSKTVIVTGASRGIGAATAVRAGRNGWRVCVNARFRFGRRLDLNRILLALPDERERDVVKMGKDPGFPTGARRDVHGNGQCLVRNLSLSCP